MEVVTQPLTRGREIYPDEAYLDCPETLPTVRAIPPLTTYYYAYVYTPRVGMPYIKYFYGPAGRGFFPDTYDRDHLAEVKRQLPEGCKLVRVRVRTETVIVGPGC